MGNSTLRFSKSFSTYFSIALICLSFSTLKAQEQMDLRELDGLNCTANDVEVLSASLGSTACPTCTPGEIITEELFITIRHNTNSDRPALAILGDLTVVDMNGNSTTTVFARCSGPIIPKKNINDNIPVGNGGNGVQTISYGEITFECGSQFTLDNILLVWTVPSDPDCPIPASDPPPPSKCGAPGISLEITPPLSAVATAECSGSDANVDLTIVGGEAPYSYTWTSLDSGFTSSEEDPQNVPQGEILSVTVTDSDGCTTTTSITTPICFVCPEFQGPAADPLNFCEDQVDPFNSFFIDSDVVDVVFRIFPSPTTDPYTGGTPLGTAVTPFGSPLRAQVQLGSLPVGTHYIYAILDVTDPDLTDPLCRPFDSFVANVYGKKDAGEDGTLTICEGETVTEEELFAALLGTPEQGGIWTPTLGGAGLYTYTHSNIACDDTRATVTVDEQEAPDAGMDGTLTICAGETVTEEQLFGALMGDPDTNGIWSPTLAGAGTYTYMIAASGSCDAVSADVVVDEQDAPAVPELDVTDATCDAAGTATITNYDDTLTYTFAPAGPTVGAGGVISGFDTGVDYTVTASSTAQSGDSCTSDAAAFNVAPATDAPAVPELDVTDATCDAAGTATITNYDDTLTYTFAPAGPTVGAGGVISGFDTGVDYTVTASSTAQSGDSCTSDAAAFNVAPATDAPAVPELDVTDATCDAAGTATITNYDDTLTYTFAPAGPTVGAGGVISGFDTGVDYTVTASSTAQSGDSCTSDAAAFNVAPATDAPAVPELDVTDATCDAAGTATITNYDDTLTYTFAPAGPTVGAGGVISGFDTGVDYTVTASSTAQSGDSCTSDAAAFNVAPATDAPEVATTTVVQPTCEVPTGTITVTVPLGADLEYSADGGTTWQAGVEFAGLAPGDYTVMVRSMDDETCMSETGPITIDPVPNAPENPLVDVFNSTCEIKGTVSITNYDDNLIYTFVPEGPDVDGIGNIIGFQPGVEYSLTTTNDYFCESGSSIFMVDLWRELSCSIEQDVLATNHQSPDGVATVYPVGGSGQYTYLWDNGETGQTATTLTYGIHTVTVTDANGCETTCQIDVAKELYCWTNLIQNVSYKGGNDGSARVFGNGGYRPYSYMWEDGTIGDVNSSLSAGIHKVTITDAKGATSTCTVTISEPNEGNCTNLTCGIEQDVLATNHQSPDGVATVYPVGGSGQYTYLWDNGETGQAATTLTYGIHTVTVTDANGCETTCQIDVAKQLYCWTNLIQNVSYKGGNDGSARVFGNGGYRPYSYMWEDGTIGDVNSSLPAGIHKVTITDAKGATSTCTVTISEPNEGNCTNLTCGIEQDVLATNHQSPDGVATVYPVGGSGQYTYLWDNGETGQAATTLTYGIHTVTVTDANGCETTCQIDVAKQLYCWTSRIQNVSYKGGNDGSARVFGNGGYRPYSYMWEDGTIGDVNSSLPAGIHKVTITDATGATSTCTVTISEPNDEVCDGIDNDGDGKIDEGFDADNDGVADCFDLCPIGDDSQDLDNDGIPDACDIEECDGMDNDGDGKVDEGFDADMDGIADCFDDCDDNLDSDQDGVPDCSDKCPGYDDNLDSDGDGTPDCMDDCDDTVDTDGDGIVDCDDQEMDSPCPDNVDANGVSLDTDGDGVVDCLDKCEGFDDTLDSDGDGTPDGCDVEECDGVDNDGDGDIDEDVILPTVEFVAFGEIRIDAGIQYNLSGGSPDGGTYSGPGVTDNGDGTYTFDPVAAGLGEHTLTYIYTNGNGCSNSATDVVNVLEAVPFTVLINEFQPNPSGNDPSTQMIELKGPAGQPFAGWIVILDSDSGNASGGVNDVEQISGTFDANGLLTVSIPDVENPSFTLILTDNYQDGIDDFDSDNDGQLDSDISNLGNVLDAIGVPDATGDENFLFGTQLGGDDFKFTGAEPMLVFRDSNTNAWYAINDHTDGMTYDLDSNPYTFSSFSGNLEGPTFGMVNPYMLTTARTFQMELWPNPTVEILNLEVPKASGIIRFDLYDISGKLVKSVPGNSWNLQQIDVRSLESGVYIIRANGGSSNNMIKKFIKR